MAPEGAYSIWYIWWCVVMTDSHRGPRPTGFSRAPWYKKQEKKKSGACALICEWTPTGIFIPPGGKIGKSGALVPLFWVFDGFCL